MIFLLKRRQAKGFEDRIGDVDKVEAEWWLAVSRGDIQKSVRRHGKHGRRIESLRVRDTRAGGGECSHVYSLEFDNGILGHRTIRAEGFIILFFTVSKRLYARFTISVEVNSQLGPRIRSSNLF